MWKGVLCPHRLQTLLSFCHPSPAVLATFGLKMPNCHQPFSFLFLVLWNTMTSHLDSNESLIKQTFFSSRHVGICRHIVCWREGNIGLFHLSPRWRVMLFRHQARQVITLSSMKQMRERGGAQKRSVSCNFLLCFKVILVPSPSRPSLVT